MTAGPGIPRPMLMVEQHEVAKPRYRAIDAHNHLGPSFGGEWARRPAAELAAVLDESGVETVVNLDGGFADNFYREMEKWSPLGERVLVFAGVGWHRLATARDLGEQAAREFEKAARAGARGLKIWKDFGLQVRDRDGQLLAVDCPQLDPLWGAAGELELPVLIHVGDPLAFFEPVNEANERWDELQRSPEWSFHSSEYPHLLTLMKGLERLIARHPRTKFIGAHVGCFAESLSYVAGMLDRLPNFYVDIGARLAELGRQPNTARRFFAAYADRILFGTDVAPNPKAYRLYYRFLETQDDNFPYWHAEDRPWQGRWFIHGLGLPEPVLQRVYYRNAQRIFKLSAESAIRRHSATE